MEKQIKASYQQLQKETKEVVHKGIYINNQRRKRKGGRIKSQSIDLKIQVYDYYSALHQSEVQWVEIERKYAKNKKKENKKTENKKQKIPVSKLQAQKVQKKSKYKQKITHVQTCNHKKQQQKKNLEDNNVDNKEIQKKEQETNYLENEQTNKQTIQKDIQRDKQSIQREKQQDKKQKIDEEQEQSQQQKQIIVAKIIKQTKIIYKQKPFVGLLYFKEKKKLKYIKKTQKQPSIFDNFVREYYFQVYPINRRLHCMTVQQPQKFQKQIMKYMEANTEILKKDMKDKSKINLLLKTLQSVYVLFKFNYWDHNEPVAEIVKVLGQINTIEGQCSCVLHQYGLNDFDHQIVSNQTELKINPTLKHKFLDKLVFTIDPASSIDLDDALSITKLEEQLYEIGIHISDVTSYLDQIDRKQLLKRTTSVYLPHKVYHMLPKHIMKICSLDPNLDRLAFSIFVKMNIKGEIIGESRIQKNIIKSRFKLSYETFQQFLIGNINYQSFNKIHQCSQNEFIQLEESLSKLGIIALAHRNQRIFFDVFENRQVQFQLNEQNWPINVSIQKRYSAKKIVEEYMIIGNVQAAKHLVRHSPYNALVIHHPPPSQLSVQMFNDSFKQFNIKFTFKDSKQTQKQLLKVKQLPNIEQNLKEACFFKARRTQQAANYKTYQEIVDGGYLKNNKIIHFALGEQYYTHFTSPMRRMSDILVHQVLNSIVFSQPIKPISNEEIQRINFGRSATKKLKRDIVEVYVCLMLMGKGKNNAFDTQGTVLSFGTQSISLFLPLLDSTKQLMWKSQLQVDKVQKKIKKPDQLRVYKHYDRISSNRDIYWDVKKFQSIQIEIGHTNDAPLRMKIKLDVKTNKGYQFINPPENL